MSDPIRGIHNPFAALNVIAAAERAAIQQQATATGVTTLNVNINVTITDSDGHEVAPEVEFLPVAAPASSTSAIPRAPILDIWDNPIPDSLIDSEGLPMATPVNEDGTPISETEAKEPRG